MINKLIPLTTGEIFIEGMNIREIKSIELRRRIGYVIQNVGLMPHWTIEQNLLTAFTLSDQKEKDRNFLHSKAEELIEFVNLPVEFLDKYPNELSGGQKQRIGVARALAARPSFILMDEPFGALDTLTRTDLQDELLKIKKTTNSTFIMVTHDIDEAFKLADRIILMDKGNIVQFDTPGNLVAHPENDFVKDFLKSKIVGSSISRLIVELPKIGYRAKRLDALELMSKRQSSVALTENGMFSALINYASLSRFRSDEEMTSL